jgi:hypothetical protein
MQAIVVLANETNPRSRVGFVPRLSNILKSVRKTRA